MNENRIIKVKKWKGQLNGVYILLYTCLYNNPCALHYTFLLTALPFHALTNLAQLSYYLWKWLSAARRSLARRRAQAGKAASLVSLVLMLCSLLTSAKASYI